jgi:hypothetical protein
MNALELKIPATLVAFLIAVAMWGISQFVENQTPSGLHGLPYGIVCKGFH